MTRDHTLTVKVSTLEFQALSSIAKNDGINISEMTRQLIHDRCHKEGFSLGMIAAPDAKEESTRKDQK